MWYGMLHSVHSSPPGSLQPGLTSKSPQFSKSIIIADTAIDNGKKGWGREEAWGGDLCSLLCSPFQERGGKGRGGREKEKGGRGRGGGDFPHRQDPHTSLL